jgi:hypothetical protein
MKRTPNLVATFAMLMLIRIPLIGPFLFAQETQPALPSDILGPPLIVWSQQQEPQPIPDSAQQLANPQAQQQLDLRRFTGKIVKDLGKYVLKVSNDNVYQDNVYQLDDQDAAKEYDGKEVKLVGALNESSNSIRVTSIQVIS